MTDDPTERVRDYIDPPPITEVVHASQEVALLLDGLLTASSSHQIVQDLLSEILKQAVEHSAMLHQSFAVVDNCLPMVENALGILDEVALREVSIGEVRVDDIQSMELVSDISNEIKTSASTLVAAIRSDTTGVMSVREDLDQASSMLVKEREAHKRQALASNQKHAKAHGVSRILGSIAHLLKGEPKSVAAMLVNLPLLGPNVGEHLKLPSEEQIKQIRERGDLVNTYEEAIGQLKDEITHTKLFEEHLNPLRAYWVGLELTMDKVCRDLESFRQDPTRRIHFRHLHEKYKEVRKHFLDYKMAVEHLEYQATRWID